MHSRMAVQDPYREFLQGKFSVVHRLLHLAFSADGINGARGDSIYLLPVAGQIAHTGFFQGSGAPVGSNAGHHSVDFKGG